MKEYIGSDEHFEDEVNAHYDAVERQNKEQQDNRNQEQNMGDAYENLYRDFQQLDRTNEILREENKRYREALDELQSTPSPTQPIDSGKGLSAEDLHERYKEETGHEISYQYWIPYYQLLEKIVAESNQSSIPAEKGHTIEDLEKVCVLNDLELTHGVFSDTCYHQTGIRLIDEKTALECFTLPTDINESLRLFYKRLKSVKVIVRNLTTSDKENKFDYPLRFIKEFRDNGINVTFLNTNEFETVRKVSPPLFEYLKSLPSITTAMQLMSGSKVGGIVGIQDALKFSAWCAVNLWSFSSRTNMWYEYQNDDNPITGEQLYAKFWWAEMEAHDRASFVAEYYGDDKDYETVKDKEIFYIWTDKNKN